MHADVHREETSEAALAFLLRPEGHNPAVLDKSAGRVLEVARVFGDTVVDIRHFSRTEIVRVGLADDFPVPLEMLPGDHHPLVQHDGAGWVVHCNPHWAGFVDEGDTRTSLAACLAGGDRLRLGDDQTLVLEVGTSLFVVRTVWLSRRLPVPVLGDVDPAVIIVALGVSAVAALLGVVGVMTPPPSASIQDDGNVETLVQLYLPPKVETPKTPVKTVEKEPGGGSGEGPTNPKKTLTKRPGSDDARVVHDKLDELFAGVDAALSETAMPSDISRGVEGLIGSKGTQLPGVDGRLSGRCLGRECTTVGLAEGPGVGNTTGRERGGEFDPFASGPGRTREAKPPAVMVAVEDPITMGGIDKSAVDAVVKRHMNQIRYCYQRELNRSPGMAGKVSVKFIIAKDGSVSSSSVGKSTLGNERVESCVTGRFLHMTFPPLRGGGIAIVNYPFVFAES
jgi:outer membrane biosynthesis protein TonB